MHKTDNNKKRNNIKILIFYKESMCSVRCSISSSML